MSLFKELQSLNYGAIGITRLHLGFPDGLVALKDKSSSKLEWNTPLDEVIDRTICFA
jgi:hypothetical protein